MPTEARLLISLAIASAFVYFTTPVAIRIADRLEFYDRPVGYKGHARPTPYLGGAAVVAGFLVAVLALGGSWDKTLPLAAGVAVLWAVGTLDDRRTVPPLARVAVEVALASLLWATGLGWDLGLGWVLDLAVTAFWIVAVVNAFNLFDNMDGAASSMAAVVCAGLAVFGAADGNVWLAVSATALCGACLGFLPFNLFRSPARIFLGDGGSMPIGFAVAGLAMAGVAGAALPWQALAMGLLFVGIPALDTTLVMISRRRRGLSIMTAGRDHLTHRAHARLRTARAVAFALGGAQAIVSALAVVAVRGGTEVLVAAVVAYLVAAGMAIAALDAGYDPTARPAVGTATVPRRRGIDWASVVLLVPLAAGLAVSPFFGGFYSSGLWVPIGLVLIAVAAGALIARPVTLTRPALLLVASLAGLGLWSLVSALWADAVEGANVAGNRWLVYVAFTLILLVAVRSARAAIALLGLIAAGALGVAAVVVVWLLGSDPAAAFLGPRLHEPLGYINGQGAFFVLAAWPCLAAAEQRRWWWLSGLGLAGAVLFASLAVLSQSRGVALGFLVAALVVLVLVPGRARRVWTLVAFAAAFAVPLRGLLDVYDGGPVGDAVRVALLAAGAGGVLWALASFAAEHLDRPPIRTAFTAAAAGLVLLVLFAAGLRAGTIADRVSTQYHAFVELEAATGEETSSRLVSGAGNRYDYWRVAWSAFRDRPVAGLGAGNYPSVYFERRGTTEDVRQPHSLPLQTLSELGLVGAALLALLLAALAWGAVRTSLAARRSPVARAVAVAGIGIVVAWLVHTSVDWMHLIPGIAGIALVAAVALVRTGPAPAPDARRRLVLGAAAALILAVAGVSLSREGLAERYRFGAQRALANDPARALTLADRSLRIDPHGLDAYYVKSAALARFDQGPAALATLQEAARRSPRNFVTWALLGDLATRMGDEAGANEYYGRARALNPRDPSL